MIRLLLLALVSAFAFPAFGATFTPLGILPGGTQSFATGVSNVGSVAVGWSHSTEGPQAFRWTPSSGITGLGDLPGGPFNSFADDVSSDGSVVVGTGRAALNQQAFRWTAATGLVNLGSLDGPDGSSGATAISPSGNIIVGQSQSQGPTNLEAFRWTPTGGMVGLGDLPGGTINSQAFGVSDDGSVIVGFGTTIFGLEAFRWTAASGMVGLGDFEGGAFNSWAHAVSGDGAVIVGTGEIANGGRAFRWTEATGMVSLGVNVTPFDASFDGSIIVGGNLGGAPPGLEGDGAFIWDSVHGVRRLRDVLINEYGLGPSLAGWHLGAATAISADGTTISGPGLGPQGQQSSWIVVIPEPPTALMVLCAVAIAALGPCIRARKGMLFRRDLSQSLPCADQ